LAGLHAIGLIGNLAVFDLATVVVWPAGDPLARCGKVIKTRLGQAVIGTILVGAIVSLSKMTVAAVAAGFGNAQLAVNGFWFWQGATSARCPAPGGAAAMGVADRAADGRRRASQPPTARCRVSGWRARG
jgi:hypothetical protein